MNFKKILSYCLSLCLIALYTGCSSSEDAEPKDEMGFITPTLEPNFESLKSSRLQVDIASGKVYWTGNDQLLVFVHESGQQPQTAAQWKACRYKFVTNSTDCTLNKFAQEANASNPLQLDSSKSYDWYVMYPYTETVLSPTGDGSFSIVEPTMNMQEPTAHIAANDVMANVLKNQKAAQKVALTLNHHATLMLFNVHNLTTESFIPKSVDFETVAANSANLAGEYTVDFEKGLTPKAGKSSFHLELSNAPTVAAGSNFTVYTIMAPFSLNANDQFNVRVITDKSNTVQSSTMKGQITFQAGTKSSANVKVTKEPILNQSIEGWEIQGESEDNIII